MPQRAHCIVLSYTQGETSKSCGGRFGKSQSTVQALFELKLNWLVGSCKNQHSRTEPTLTGEDAFESAWRYTLCGLNRQSRKADDTKRG